MMRRAWTALGLSCVVVATTVAGVEEPTKTSTTRTKSGRVSTSADVEKDIRSKTIIDNLPNPKHDRRAAQLSHLLNDPLLLGDLAGKPLLNPNKDFIIEPNRSDEVRPAIVVPKKPTNELLIPINPRTGIDEATGRIKFKIKNELKGRSELFPSDRIYSIAGADLRPIEEIIAKHGGTVQQLIQKSPMKLRSIETKAFDLSNRLQPDLASMMVVKFPNKDLDRLLTVARELNEQPTTEWVSIERTVSIYQEDLAGCQPINPDSCHLPSRVEGPLCDPLNIGLFPEPFCDGTRTGIYPPFTDVPAPGALESVFMTGRTAGGWPGGPLGFGGTYLCWDPVTITYEYSASPLNTTGTPGFPPVGNYIRPTGDFPGPPPQVPVPTTPQPGVFPGNCNPDPECVLDEPSICMYGCQDAACCEAVGELLPYCIDDESPRGWDVYCAAMANTICDGTVYETPPGIYDPCLSTYPPGTLPQDILPVDKEENAVFENVRFLFPGRCDEPHTFGGCSNVQCCVLVCATDPLCCSDEWDENCVALSLSGDIPECSIPDVPGTPTPPFMAEPAATFSLEPLTSGNQAWIRAEPVVGNPNQIPPFESGLPPTFSYPALGPYPPIQVTDFKYDTSGLVGPQGQPGGPIDASFRYSNYRGGGFDIPGLENLAGQLWANYGAGGRPGNSVLPNPTKVWLYGAEFEIVDTSTNCRGVDQQYNCADCLSQSEIKQVYPDFYEGASTRTAGTGLQPTSKLCPTGRKLGAAVIEFSAFVNHEEFICESQTANGTCQTQYYLPKVILEPGQTPSLIEESANEPQHGTACLGILVAGDNQFGIRGMVNQAQGYFFPVVSNEEGDRTETAIASALDMLVPGSVINMSMGPGGGNVMTSDPAIYNLATIANDLMIVFLESAGNDGLELTGEAGDDSGAIIVGACTPGPTIENNGVAGCPDGALQKLAFCGWWASRWAPADEERPDGTALLPVCAWGAAVTTTGYGSLFRGDNNPTPQGEELERDQLRTYDGPSASSSGFGGTSAASPLMAGAAVWLQGFAYMFYDTPLTSRGIRLALAETEGGRGTCSDGLGNPVPDIPTCQDTDPEEDPRPIGVFQGANLRACAMNLIIRQGTNYTGKLKIYTGTHVAGNEISLGTVDGNTLRIRSEPAAQGPGPADLTYLGSGNTADFGVVFSTGITPDEVLNLSVNVNGAASGAGGAAGPTLVLLIPYLKNNLSQRYTPLGVEFLTSLLVDYEFDVGEFVPPQVFFDSEGKVDMRIYSLGLGFLASPNILTRWDLVQLSINEDNGKNDP